MASGQGTLVYRQLKDENGVSFPDFANLDEKWDAGAEYLSVYPNVLLGVHRDHSFAIILRPDGPNRTEEHVHLYYAAPETDDALRNKNTEQWKVVFEEDIFVVEGMQRGRQAPGFDGGRFSPAMDGPTHCFHRWAANRIAQHRQAG
jgi:phenylpropionate dioxygenase-like ring-hydroxylating dioxygenase large terminal subunit